MVTDPKTRRLVAVLASVLGVALIVVGVIYLAETAHAIPSWFPGHDASPTSHHHTKHGIAAILLGLAVLAFAWFQLGPRNQPPDAAP